MHIACGRIYFMVSHRDPCSVLYYSMYIYVTYSIFWKTQTLQAMRMILQFIRQTKKKQPVISALETSSSLLFRWFNNNFMKANSDKSDVIMSCVEATTAMIDGLPIDSSKTEVLLGITIDHELKFDNHVNNLCKKASLKLNALARIAAYMNFSKKRIIMKSFIESQFGYCPLIWMFHSRGLNNKINRIHERALRITYNDKSSSYGELLTKDRSVTMHHRNIRALAIEIYKVIQGISPPFLN